VITAADVFCYFGELGTVLSAAARLLCSGGTIVFSVEELTAGRASYELLEHGRYAHSASYLGNIWTGIGIAPVCISRAMLRFERGTPVHGLVAAVR